MTDQTIDQPHRAPHAESSSADWSSSHSPDGPAPASNDKAAEKARSDMTNLFAIIGFVTVLVLFAWAIYAAGKGLLYDDAFNDGFEAGRASIARACANPDQGLAVARGCPVK
jgi:hypothetical protein